MIIRGIIQGDNRKPRTTAFPRKWTRTTPNAAVVPSTTAIKVATMPTRALSNSADVHSLLPKKFAYHRIDTPGNGQVMNVVDVKDIGTTTSTGRTMKAIKAAQYTTRSHAPLPRALPSLASVIAKSGQSIEAEESVVDGVQGDGAAEEDETKSSAVFPID